MIKGQYRLQANSIRIQVLYRHRSPRSRPLNIQVPSLRLCSLRASIPRSLRIRLALTSPLTYTPSTSRPSIATGRPPTHGRRAVERDAIRTPTKTLLPFPVSLSIVHGDLREERNTPLHFDNSRDRLSSSEKLELGGIIA